MKYDVIIIGGGLGGLCSAVICAKEGKKVLVLEQHSKPGGYLHSFYRNGFRFETGFHFVPELGRNGILEYYWNYLEIPDQLETVPYNPSHFQTLVFPDMQIKLPAGLDNLAGTLAELFPVEKEKIREILDYYQTIRTWFEYYDRNHAGNSKEKNKTFQVTINDYLDSVGVSEQLKAVLLSVSFLHGIPPKRAPLGLHAMFTNALYSPLHDIRGGGDALISALVNTLRRYGGELLTGTTVTNICKTDGNFLVITGDDTAHEADLVISSIHPASTLALFDEGAFRNVYKKRIDGMKNTAAHFGAYAISSGDLDSMAHDFFYLPGYDIDDMFERPLSGSPDDFFIYATVPTARTGRIEGKHIIEAVTLDDIGCYKAWADKIRGNSPESYNKHKQEILYRMLETIDTRLFPINGTIDYATASTPLTNLRYTHSPGGSMYGIEHSVDQMRAPVLSRTRVRNLYLTGQSVGFPGISGVTITSFATCADIFGKAYLFKKLDEANG
jgi:all-trans-retinol 13,14-reductase